MKKKVFLGGTCNKSTWRDVLIPQLKVQYFNPVVDVWTDEDYHEELHQRKTCDYCLYVISSEMKGVYSIAEAVDDSNKYPNKTLFCFLNNGFSRHQIKSLEAVGKMIVQNGGKWLKTLNEVAFFLNQTQNKL